MQLSMEEIKMNLKNQARGKNFNKNTKYKS